MTLSDYSQLKQQVVISVASRDSHTNVIQSLKELFKEGINSVRRLEHVKTIEQLLQVLELRGLLSGDNIAPLKDIANKLESRTLLNKIHEYEKYHESGECLNYYTPERNKSMSLGGFMNSTQSVPGKKERIFQIVTERIGSAWRDLARNLKIQEYKIDEIDEKYTTLQTKASEMLKLFYMWADKEKWHFVLCEALDKTRRKQLRISVQEVLMNS